MANLSEDAPIAYVVMWCGIFLNVLVCTCFFWIVWNYCGVGVTYFEGVLPEQFLTPSFWNIFGLITCVRVIQKP